MEIFEILLNGLKKIPGIDNDWDRYLYPFKGSLAEDQKRFLGIPQSEKVIYVRIIDADKSVPCSLAITDKGIYYRFINKFFWATVQDKKFNIKFQDVNSVNYSEREDAFIFSDGSSLNRHTLVKKLESNYRFEFAKVLNEAINASIGILDYYNKGISLTEEEKYDEALIEFNKAITLGSEDFDFAKSDERAYLYFWRGRCLMLLDRDFESKSNLIIAKDICCKSSDTEIKDLLPAINANLAHVVESRIESHKLLCEAINDVDDLDAKKDLLEELKELHNSEAFKSQFKSTNSIAERKVIIVTKDNVLPLPTKSLMSLERSGIQSLNIDFPLGHPVEGSVYMLHPTKQNYYIPSDKYEEAIFLEKVSEYCYLLRCLGAKEIKIQSIIGKSLDEMNKSEVDVNTSFGRKSFGLEGNVNYQNQQDCNSENLYQFKNSMVFQPIGKPFVPNDLNWLAVEPKWKRLIDNRLSGNLTHYVEEISTSTSNILSESEKININLEIKALITKFKGQVNIQDTQSNTSKQTTTWRIEVDF